MVPISRKVRDDTDEECFHHVRMDLNQDTGALDGVWSSSCRPNVSITAPGGQKSAQNDNQDP